MMRSLAEFVLRGRWQAVLTALLFSVLPFLGWMADVVMILVTLRKGAKEGAFVLLWVLLPSVILALRGYPLLWVYNVFGGSLLAYGLALILRYTGSWAIVLQAGVLVGIVAVVGIHIYMPSITDTWIKLANTYLPAAQKTFNIPLTIDHKWLVRFASVATGIQALILLFGNLFNIAVARWLQALLYNPQGLHKELYNIRMGNIAIIALIIIALFSMFGNKIALDCLILALAPFMCAGLSLVHCIAAASKSPWLWLIGFYFMLVALFIYFAALLVMMGLIDTWQDFRKRLPNPVN